MSKLYTYMCILVLEPAWTTGCTGCSGWTRCAGLAGEGFVGVAVGVVLGGVVLVGVVVPVGAGGGGGLGRPP